MREYIITDEQLERLGGLAERINDTGFTLELGRICRELQRIVRCEDCKYSWMNGTVCHWFESYSGFSDEPIPSTVDPDGFCAWGERKVDA